MVLTISPRVYSSLGPRPAVLPTSLPSSRHLKHNPKLPHLPSPCGPKQLVLGSSLSPITNASDKGKEEKGLAVVQKTPGQYIWPRLCKKLLISPAWYVGGYCLSPSPCSLLFTKAEMGFLTLARRTWSRAQTICSTEPFHLPRHPSLSFHVQRWGKERMADTQEAAERCGMPSHPQEQALCVQSHAHSHLPPCEHGHLWQHTSKPHAIVHGAGRPGNPRAVGERQHGPGDIASASRGR